MQRREFIAALVAMAMVSSFCRKGAAGGAANRFALQCVVARLCAYDRSVPERP